MTEEEKRWRAVVDRVCHMLTRADDAVPAELRADWPALKTVDAAGGLARLREQLLAGDIGLGIALISDLTAREREIEALEGRQHGGLEDLVAALKQLRRMTSEQRVPGVSETLDAAWRALGAIEAEAALRWRWRPVPGTGARVTSRRDSWAEKTLNEVIASWQPQK